MNDFQGLLSGDYGFKPQGKSAPMAPSRSNPNPSSSSPSFDFDLKKPPTYSKNPSPGVFLDDHDDFFSRPASATSTTKAPLDDVFGGPGDSGARFSSMPVFDKPVYDDDVFEAVPGLKNSSSAKYADVFSSSNKKHDAFDDLLGGFASKGPESKGLGGSGRRNDADLPNFDDLLPGFGGRSASPSDRNPAESSWDNRSTVNGSAKATSGVGDPFAGLNSRSSDAAPSQGFYSDPLEQFSELGGSSRKKTENVSASGGIFDDIDPLVGLGKSVPMNDREKNESPARTRTASNSGHTSASFEASEKSSSVRSPASGFEKKMAAGDYYESPSFDTFSASEDSHRAAPNTSSSSFVNASDDTSSKNYTSNVYESNLDSSDDVWLTVSEIPLFTQPTAAPPPLRPPPPRPPRMSKARSGSYPPPYAKKKGDDHPSFPSSAQSYQSPISAPVGGQSSFSSPIDELEDFANRSSWNDSDGNSDVLSGDDMERQSDAAVSAAAASAAAMKEAMDKAEAKFKHAKEVRVRENAKAARMQQEREEKTVPDFQEREFKELQERQERERQRREEEDRKQREEEERVRREREEREREQKRVERERMERDHARQAVERATREARERAAADARVRAEKAAVGKVQAEARERAERAAVMKAQAAARERAARAAFEAKQKADKEKAEREAKEKEAREKAAAAASARANQHKNENDLESFFGMGSRANSAPKTRASSSDPFFDSQPPKKQSESVRTSVASTTNIRKTSSSTNIVDDLSSIFGGAPAAGEFQEVEGETEERRRARLERHQRTRERTVKALAEKNKRDLDAQNEQAERHRISGTLDVEIKRWAAGKEGNLRALLSTMQYVLWPECGWQPVSLTDLITGASVKKVYRKATLCIHPDKVQQKGATLQQKYIAEKVFDLLKEAWNKFNSEELF